MSEQKMISTLEEVLEIEQGSLTVDSKLSDYPEWDSLAIISLLAYFEGELGKKISPKVIKAFVTVADVVKYM